MSRVSWTHGFYTRAMHALVWLGISELDIPYSEHYQSRTLQYRRWLASIVGHVVFISLASMFAFLLFTTFCCRLTRLWQIITSGWSKITIGWLKITSLQQKITSCWCKITIVFYNTILSLFLPRFRRFFMTRFWASFCLDFSGFLWHDLKHRFTTISTVSYDTILSLLPRFQITIVWLKITTLWQIITSGWSKITIGWLKITSLQQKITSCWCKITIVFYDTILSPFLPRFRRFFMTRFWASFCLDFGDFLLQDLKHHFATISAVFYDTILSLFLPRFRRFFMTGFKASFCNDFGGFLWHDFEPLFVSILSVFYGTILSLFLPWFWRIFMTRFKTSFYNDFGGFLWHDFEPLA